MSNPMKVTLSEQAGAVVVRPEGEIGYQEAPEFRTFLKSAYAKKPSRVIADLSSVSYMGTPGLATLVEAMQISRKSETPLVLCGLNERVRAIFEIARLQSVFTIVDSVDAALNA